MVNMGLPTYNNYSAAHANMTMRDVLNGVGPIVLPGFVLAPGLRHIIYTVIQRGKETCFKV